MGRSEPALTTDRAAPEPIAEPGRNCWRRERADRAAFLVDGEAYFRTLYDACLHAQDTIFIVGWDLDSRMPLRHDGEGPLPPVLGPFLAALARRRRGLRIYILGWAFPLIFARDREPNPYRAFGRRSMPRNVSFHLDDTFQSPASCHQKIVVIDDALAFVGGQDLTARRWDTSAHAQDDPRRIGPDGKPYPPIHEIMLALEGPAARALGELARERWRGATGRTPRRGGGSRDRWPASLRPDLQDVDVALARTMPDPDGEPVREVERLYLDTIAAARRTIYAENQFFTSTLIGQAIARRLQEPDGPEVVLVTSRTAMSWLEETTMGVLRARLLDRLRRVDRHGRLHVYCPLAPGPGDVGVKVHAKLMIVDDELVRVGSSNINNRSLVLDPECDAMIEALGDPVVGSAIRALRQRLLAEHLRVEPAALAEAEREAGTLHGAIERLAGEPRYLPELAPEVPAWLNDVVPGEALLDPSGPYDPEQIAEELLPEDIEREVSRSPLALLGIVAGTLLLLAAAWQFTPLGAFLRPSRLAAMMLPEAPLLASLFAVALVYLLAGLIAVPINLLIFSTGLAFGAFEGALYSLFGASLSAAGLYGAGSALGRRLVTRIAGLKLRRIALRIGRHGFLAVAAVRVVPVAPFTIVNLVCGATRIPFRPYMLGTLVGLLPGTIAMALFGGQIAALFREPTLLRAAGAAALVLAIVAIAFLLRRIFPARGADG